jgi:hypothetical protein
MTCSRQQMIQDIHASRHRVVLAVTGGGTAGVADLLAVPGASRTVLEAVVPYSAAALTDWIGRPPEASCSGETALVMAAVAWKRAARLNRLSGETPCDESRLVGLACTAALASDRPKRGEHRCYVATQTAAATQLRSLVLSKGARDRAGEDRVVGDLILQALAAVCGCPEAPQPELASGEQIVVDVAQADPLLADVWCGRSPVVWSLPDGRLALEPPVRPVGILSGAFNPLHQGHVALQATAEAHLQGPVAFEMPVNNADKPPLDYLTTERRRRQFTQRLLALTAAPTFVRKAEFLPNTVFIVGFDTAERIVQARFYDDRDDFMQRALAYIRAQGCRFLVAGRKTDNTFHTVRDIALPAGFADLFEELPETDFREDISSTELRRR